MSEINFEGHVLLLHYLSMHLYVEDELSCFFLCGLKEKNDSLFTPWSFSFPPFFLSVSLILSLQQSP